MRHLVALVTLVFCSGAFGAVSPEWISGQEKIKELAKDLCQMVKEEGGTNSVKVGADVSVKVGRLNRFLESIGFGVIADYEDKTYSGVLQEQLLEALKHQTKCRERWVETYNAILTGKDQRLRKEAIKRARAKPIVKPTVEWSGEDIDLRQCEKREEVEREGFKAEVMGKWTIQTTKEGVGTAFFICKFDIPKGVQKATLQVLDLVVDHTYVNGSGGGEPPRVCRRLHNLRGWSHEDIKQAVFPGSS